MESRRAESFSDGVFAVAITILIFNLLPIGAQLLNARVLLQEHWPNYFAYVVSFLTIGIIWVNHHTVLAQVTKVDRPLLVRNLFLLMGIVALPVPTALVAEHLTGKYVSGGQLATVTYGLVMIAISVGYASMWLYIISHQEKLGARQRISQPRQATLRFTGGLAGYVAGTLVAAFFSPVLALALFGALAIYYMFEHLPEPAAPEARPGSDGDPAADGS